MTEIIETIGVSILLTLLVVLGIMAATMLGKRAGNLVFHLIQKHRKD